ncbi:MAG: lipopolysaccharide assembly protein LapA domain-containing protein [Pseudoprimorskyibacter sp.]|jgi:putative membrane protein|nr:lipopolysaccharide assembly protein LapA domain-containing protein [Pseudoprimorskyibacter sp.]
MRYILYVFLGVLVAFLVSLSVANMHPLTLNLLPDGLVDAFGFQHTSMFPVFVVVWVAFAIGLAMGYIIEYLREWGHRRQAARQANDLKQLEREVARVKGQRDEGKDEILALVDENS